MVVNKQRVLIPGSTKVLLLLFFPYLPLGPIHVFLKKDGWMVLGHILVLPMINFCVTLCGFWACNLSMKQGSLFVLFCLDEIHPPNRNA
jgi:hypothetical protein